MSWFKHSLDGDTHLIREKPQHPVEEVRLWWLNEPRTCGCEIARGQLTMVDLDADVLAKESLDLLDRGFLR